MRKTFLSHFCPPTPDAIRRKACRVVVDADVDPTFVFRDIVNAIGNRLAKFLVRAVLAGQGVHVRFHRLSLRSPVMPFVAEISEPCFNKHGLLFRIDGNDRLIRMQKTLDLVVDVRKLVVPVRAVGSFPRFSVRLKAIFYFVQQCANGIQRNVDFEFLQLVGKSSNAFARPAKWPSVVNTGGSPRVTGSIRASSSSRILG